MPFFLQQCCWGSLIGTCVVVPVYLYRGRIQRGAMSMVLPSDANGLVAVAALMRSGLSPRAFEQRTLEAVRMLRTLPWSALREEHFESAQSSEEERLYFRATSRPATFGEVDAFISAGVTEGRSDSVPSNHGPESSSKRALVNAQGTDMP